MIADVNKVAGESLLLKLMSVSRQQELEKL